VSELHSESKAMTTQARFTSCSEVPPSGRPWSTHPGRLKTVRRCSQVVLLRRTINSWLSVPKILPLFIPEILSHPVNAGKAKTLPVPPVGKPGRRREEDVRNAKATQSRDSVEGRGTPRPKWPVWRECPCALSSALRKKPQSFMSMMPPSERSGGSADPALLRISGNWL
jgi:hypothetical protein